MWNNLSQKSKILIISILLVRMATFMSYPFLAIRLEQLEFSSMQIGIIIGLPYFFSGISGVFGGNIADQWGKKRTMILTLLLGGLAFFGLGEADHLLSCLFFNLLILICSVVFEAAASALMAVSTSQELIDAAFRYRYIAINLGASIGPMIGGGLAYYGMSISFAITGILFLCFSFFLATLKNEQKEKSVSFSLPHLKTALVHMSKHHSFLYLVGANFFISMTYCQMLSTLPQILNNHFGDGLELYSILLSVNPITVITIGIFFTRFLSGQSTRLLFTTGCLILFVTFMGFQFFQSTYQNYIFLMITFTLGEIILMPTSSKFLVELAPLEHRSTYLGSESCYHLGFFAGNLIGGYLLQKGDSVFLFCGACALVGMGLYRLSYNSFLKEKESDLLRAIALN